MFPFLPQPILLLANSCPLRYSTKFFLQADESQSCLLTGPPLALLRFNNLSIPLQLLEDHQNPILCRREQILWIVPVDDLDHLHARPLFRAGVFLGEATLDFAVALADGGDGVVRGQCPAFGRRRSLDRPVLEDIQRLEFPHAAVRNVLVDLGHRIFNHGAVAREGGAWGFGAVARLKMPHALLDVSLHQRQTVQVEAQVLKHGRPVPEHVVRREDGAHFARIRRRRDDECHVVLRVARRVDRLDFDSPVPVRAEALPVLNVDHALCV